MSACLFKFTLSAIYEILLSTAQDSEQVTEQVDRVEKILTFCKVPRTREEIQTFAGIMHREYFRAKILKPLLDSGRLIMTIPDKPNNKNQRYVRNVVI